MTDLNVNSLCGKNLFIVHQKLSCLTAMFIEYVEALWN